MNNRRIAMMFLAAGMSILIAGIMAVFDAPTVNADGGNLAEWNTVWAHPETEQRLAEQPIAEKAGLAMPVAQDSVSAALQNVTGNNSFCVLCHNVNAQASFQLADGTQHSIAVDPDVLENSVHGSSSEEGALGCVDCHGADYFPHDPLAQQTTRAYTAVNSLVCTQCHVEQTENLATDVHYTALTEGNLRAATCVDCHGAHDVQPPAEPLTRISETCGDCHQIVFNEYEDSVHGRALFAGDENVPTCVSCHGVHGIQHPTTAMFRNRSPELCADCHADEELMAEYDISTNVFNSYVSDFHGTTVSLFEQSDPNVPTNKAVCYDCHGVHDIPATDDETASIAIRENLLATCRECHPGATADFPDSWVGHFPPTLESHPLVFLVDLFYQFFIPGVLGVFVFLVATDIFARVRNISGRGKKES